VIRDSFACKPAVIAETPDYVAMASEYHALAGLPGIAGARVFEPMPEEIHVWSR
jgi:glutamate synthase domain-containing protein 1